MFRTLPWLLAVMALFELLLQSADGGRLFLQVLQLRQALLRASESAQDTFCADPVPHISLFWRENGSWADACAPFPEDARGLPRYWKVEARLKYRLLFLQQLPITISIVILS